MTAPSGIYVLALIGGPAAARIAETTARFDPKLARRHPAHLTLAGSSGMGPLRADYTAERLRALIEPIASRTAPIPLQFGTVERFSGTNVVVLPLSPHGALRHLHDAIKRSGVEFERPRFAFTPHVTLSFFPTLAPDALRELLAVRISEPAWVDRLLLSRTREPQSPEDLLELTLGTRNQGIRE